MYFDPLYLLFALPALLLGLFAQARVKSNFNKYSRVATMRGVTGAQVARALLDSFGLHDVQVEAARGFLTDHYDPRSKTLRLSEATYASPSIAAVGVAAHEMGHALQHSQNYAPLALRSAIVPAAQFGSGLGPWLLFGGMILNVGALAWAGIALYAAATAFTLVTLPVEIDASKRAKALLMRQGYLNQQELVGVNKVLDAAALTYVAAAVQSILTLLYFVLRLTGAQRD
ncbi:MAG: zinc metallopeptidase [Candidatus Promineifilaceae bacterium]